MAQGKELSLCRDKGTGGRGNEGTEGRGIDDGLSPKCGRRRAEKNETLPFSLGREKMKGLKDFG